jgi:hypothetical protein
MRTSALHVGLAGADGTAEREFTPEARVMHPHRDAQRATLGSLAITPVVAVVHDRDLAIVDAGETRAHRAFRHAIEEMRLGGDVGFGAWQYGCVHWVFAGLAPPGSGSFCGWGWNGTRFSHSRSACQ